MTPFQQAALEQVAREWLMNNEIAHWGGRTSALVELLAAQRAAGLEEVANELEESNPKWLTGWAQHFRMKAQEQRP